MTRRLLYIALGATVGILLVRKATEAAHKLTPAGLQDSATSAFASFRQELRVGMAEREAELRTELGLDGTHDVIDT